MFVDFISDSENQAKWLHHGKEIKDTFIAFNAKVNILVITVCISVTPSLYPDIDQESKSSISVPNICAHVEISQFILSTPLYMHMHTVMEQRIG